jgi:hypothetical protein
MLRALHDMFSFRLRVLSGTCSWRIKACFALHGGSSARMDPLQRTKSLPLAAWLDSLRSEHSAWRSRRAAETDRLCDLSIHFKSERFAFSSKFSFYARWFGRKLLRNYSEICGKLLRLGSTGCM